MNKLMSLSFLILISSPSVFAKDSKEEPKVCPVQRGTDLPLPADVEFQIESYTKETKSYTASVVKLPDESNMNITLEALGDIVPKVKENFGVILRKPEDIVGEKYKASKPLKVLTFTELEARRGCIRKTDQFPE